MAGAPHLKVFNKAGEYVAACKHAEDAAAIIAAYGDGSSIRVGHSKSYTVWHEGLEGQPAAESYDHVAQVVAKRIEYLANFGSKALAAALRTTNSLRPREVKS
jgi:predicted TIM-barrel enzyme